MPDHKPDTRNELTTKRHHKTREEEADRCLNHTVYSKGSAVMVVLIFLAFVFGVPLAQHIVEIRQNLAARAAWNPKSGQPEPGIAPRIYHVVDLLPSREQISQAKGFWGYWSLIPSTESIGEFEKGLKEESVLTKALLSPAQLALTGVFGVGNEKAYCGREGWLFYEPDVEYLTLAGFLTPTRLRERSHQSDQQPDPIKAILDFKRQLDARHISLVVMPVPTKPMIEPEQLVAAIAPGTELQNPSFAEFTSLLEANGVTVYDPTRFLLDRKSQTGRHQYLETDTHWRPEAMDAVSADLALYIKSRSGLPPPASDPQYTLGSETTTNLGDIAEMLKLPPSQQIYHPQTVTTEPVRLPGGEPWSATKDADVLLLGDSFSNIFSLKEMNWGAASGFAEHLSYHLGRPVDKIVINSGGAFASRTDLARQMRRADRLAGKRVVVYEFSMRDLTGGDWKIIEMPTPPKATTVEVKPSETHIGPPAETTPFKILSVTPASFDPTKKQSATFEISVPHGKWRATIEDADDKPVAPAGQGAAVANGPVTVKWNGLVDGKPAKPGVYQLVLAGTRPDGKAIDPVSANVAVLGAPTGDIVAAGANPDTIDALAKAVTTVEFTVPADGKYVSEVMDGAGKVVRKLDRRIAKPGPLEVTWNGADDKGRPVADGRYTIRLQAADAASKLKPAQTKVTVKSKKPTPVTKPTKPAPVAELIVTGRILDRAKTPTPGDVPYKDCIIALQLTDIHVVGGKLGNGDIGVYVWGMRDNKLVDGAFVKGSTVTLHLVPWGKVEGKYGSFNRQDLDSDAAQSLDYYWGEIK